MHGGVGGCAREYGRAGERGFFVCTYGGAKGAGSRTLRRIAAEKGCPVLGEFGCKGYDTFGPFRLVGGLAKGRPNERDLEKARAFYRGISAR